MAAFTILVQDLSEDTPENVDVMPAPYDILQTTEVQISITYQKLQRASRRKNRILVLVYAFYLGELLENIPNRKQRSWLSSQITPYYSTASRRVYTIFEKMGVTQLYRTRSTILHLIYQMPHSDFITLTQD
jgi:hypothetical protein